MNTGKLDSEVRMRFSKIQVALSVLVVTSACITTKNIESTPANGSISGKVVDALNGQPLPGVGVYLIGTDIGIATDDEGYYFLPNVPVGNYDVEYSLIGYETSILKVAKASVKKGTTVNVRLMH